MDSYTLLHHFALFVSLLLLPLIPSPIKTVANNSEDVEDLILTRVGHIPGQGLYVCFTREDGAALDLGLQYTATYTHGHPSTHSSCNGDLTHHGAENGCFCLPPCPGTTHMLRPVSLTVTGHDRTTREATTALVESFTLLDMAPVVVQAGRGVLEVQWTGRPGSTFKVQVWHHPLAAREEPTLNKSETEERASASGGMDDEILMKVRQCYHESDYNNEDNDDDDDDDDDSDDDDDHEEDNDDFLKWKRWRRCIVLHAPRVPVSPAAATPAVVHTSGPLTCLTNTCLYYVTDTSASGSVSVAVMDVTQSIVHAFHTVPTPMREWADLPVQAVMITSAFVNAAPRPKAMTITVQDGSPGRGAASSGKAEAESEVALAEEVDKEKGDLQAMVINGHSYSEGLRSLAGECGPLGLSDAGGVVCSVKALETLVDPEGKGPISNLLLLLVSHATAASTLLIITDVHVRVRKVGQGAVLVLWDRDPAVQEFAVSVAPEAGLAYNTVAVACDKRGSDCLVTFQGLTPGRYTAEVSYDRQARVHLRESFIIEKETVCDSE